MRANLHRFFGQLGGRLWRLGLLPRLRLRCTALRHPAPRSAPALAGMRIGLVSDVHLGHYTTEAELREQVGRLADAELDLLLVAGDLIDAYTAGEAEARLVLEAFGTVPAPLGRFVVPGNHDGPESRRALEDAARYGFVALLNEGRRIDYKGQPLYLAGLDDRSTGCPDAEAAYADHAGEPVLLLVHNPDVVLEHLSAAHPTWLALAGHLHGLPASRLLQRLQLSASRYADRLGYGWARIERPLYVSSGSGLSSIPLRVLAPLEVCVIEIRSAGN